MARFVNVRRKQFDGNNQDEILFGAPARSVDQKINGKGGSDLIYGDTGGFSRNVSDNPWLPSDLGPLFRTTGLDISRDVGGTLFQPLVATEGGERFYMLLDVPQPADIVFDIDFGVALGTSLDVTFSIQRFNTLDAPFLESRIVSDIGSFFVDIGNVDPNENVNLAQPGTYLITVYPDDVVGGFNAGDVMLLNIISADLPGETFAQGDDTLVGGGGSDTIFGFGGNDLLRGGKGADYLDGGRGRDSLEGGPGDDNLTLLGRRSEGDGGGGVDSITSYGARSRLDGDAGRDNLAAFGNRSTADGGDDLDLVGVFGANSVARGGKGSDVVNSFGDGATLLGGAGADRLQTFDGDATLRGGKGQDTLVDFSGDGRTVMTGGKGRDIFVNGNDAGPRTVITDFTPGVDVLAFLTVPPKVTKQKVDNGTLLAVDDALVLLRDLKPREFDADRDIDTSL